VYVTGGPTVAYAAATGAMRWESAGTTVTGSKTAVSPGGSTVFVTGTSPGSGGSTDYGTAAYDSATGAQLWTVSYHGPGTGSDAADAIAVSPDGSQVFVTGESSNGTGSTTGFATVAYDASTGAQLWAARYDGPAAGLDDAVAVAVSPDGSRVFVTGVTNSKTPDATDYGTVAYNATTGTRIWVQLYSGPDGGHNQASSAAINPAGSELFVTGGNAEDGSQQFGTVAYQP
jgi:PQQ-like domain